MKIIHPTKAVEVSSSLMPPATQNSTTLPRVQDRALTEPQQSLLFLAYRSAAHTGRKPASPLHRIRFEYDVGGLP